MPTEVLVFQEHITRSTKGGPVHKFRAEDGRWMDTFDADLATKVVAQLTNAATYQYEEFQNGQYTNYKLLGVEGAESAAKTTNGSSGGQTTTSPGKPSQAYWDEKDQRITRSFGVNASLQALNITGGDVEAAKQILQAAVELAPIAAVYAWAGKK